ncbi:aldehyde dehydrogenase family protein [Paenibacillus prosopidis]|nr:aldehyde dehydrogenase family protein [Paenibacillus prosopidis]
MNKFENRFKSQREYFNTNVTRSYEWRIEQLERMERMIGENNIALQEAMERDFKTASQEKVFETSAMLATIQFMKHELKSWMEPVEAPLPKFLRESGHKGIVTRDPYGVALIIGAYNGPLTLLIHPALTALTAGNTCILKLPATLTATNALLLELVPKYFDPRAVTAVTGNREEITELLKLPFDFIFFTGSTKTGKVIMKAAAENLTPVLLELGGQNPALVDETANIPDAAKKLVWGATAWGGQWCTSPGYAYVHESVAEEFVSEAKKAVIELYGNDPKNNPDFSNIINAREVERLASLIDPSKVVSGGQYDAEARHFDPTILYPVTFDDKIMEGEIFGPILPIIIYKTLDEAFTQITSMPRPLGAYVFSRDQKTIDRFIGGLSFGGGAVNQTNVQLFIESMPFGGIGPSGMGHYYGKYGFDSLTHAKSMLISPPDVGIDHLLPPYTQEKVEALVKWSDY